MKFSIFEILAWMTFLAVLSASLVHGIIGEAALILGWFVITIVALKLFGRLAAFIVALSIAVVLSVLGAMSPISANIPFLASLIWLLILYCSVASLFWAFTLAVDAIIVFLQRRLVRNGGSLGANKVSPLSKNAGDCATLGPSHSETRSAN